MKRTRHTAEQINRKAQVSRAADLPGQNRPRGLPCHRGDSADLPPLAAAVWRHAGRGSQAPHPPGEEERPTQDASGSSGVGEGDAQGPCCAIRCTLRCDGKLLSPERRCAAKRTSRCDRAVAGLQERYRASERFVCQVVGQHRSTQRHPVNVVDLEETKLRQRLRDIAAEHIRWGRRMAYRLLMREGWMVNHKRVQRLWREEGLQRPTPRTRKRARPAEAPCAVTGLSIPTGCGPWTSSSIPRPMAAGLSS